MLNIAHRGARNIAPENTLVAARLAHQAGADIWEFDVQLTEDGHLVVIHDDTLVRTTNVQEIFPGRDSYRVDEFILSEIKKLDAGSWFLEKDPFGEIKQGNVSPDELAAYRGEKIPTLKEALQLSRELGLGANIEVKSFEGTAISGEQINLEVLHGIDRVVEGLEMESDVLVSSFDHSVVRKIRKLNPKIPGAILVDQTFDSPTGYMRQNDVRTLIISVSALKTKEGKRNLIEINRADKNYRVFVWTVNELDVLHKFIQNSCVSGIVTDYPARLAEML